MKETGGKTQIRKKENNNITIFKNHVMTRKYTYKSFRTNIGLFFKISNTYNSPSIKCFFDVIILV